MRQRRSSSLNARPKCRKIGCGSGADVFAHHQRYAHIDRKNARGTEQNSYCHYCRRRLHKASNNSAGKQKNKYRKVTSSIKRSKETHNRSVVLHIHIPTSAVEHHKRPKHKGKSKQEIARSSMLSPVNQHNTHKKRGKNHIGKVYIISKRHYPRRKRSADICAHYHRNSLSQSE